MTILTDIGWDLLLNVDMGNESALASLVLGTSSSACAADHVHKCKVLQFAYASSLGCFQGAFSARSRKRSGGVGPLCLKTRFERKIEISTAMC